MVRNPQSPEYNIPERVEDFVSYLEEQVIFVGCREKIGLNGLLGCNGRHHVKFFNKNL